MIDLIFKINSRDGWSATLRNDPSVVLVADNGDDLAQLTRELALAILQGRRTEALREMRLAGTMLLAPEPDAGDASVEQIDTAVPLSRPLVPPIARADR